MPIKAKASKLLILAASMVFVLIPLLMNISPPSALACSGCPENYPFLHYFPTEGEITDAKAKFVEEYTAGMLQKYREVTIVDTWQIKLKRPGIEGQDDVVNVILCFTTEENIEGGVKSASYHYTKIAYDESRGFFFWPYSMGSFASREKLDAFIREHIIERSNNQQVVELSNLGSLPFAQFQKAWGFPLIAMLLLVGLMLVFLKVRAKSGQ